MHAGFLEFFPRIHFKAGPNPLPCSWTPLLCQQIGFIDVNEEAACCFCCSSGGGNNGGLGQHVLQNPPSPPLSAVSLSHQEFVKGFDHVEIPHMQLRA